MRWWAFWRRIQYSAGVAVFFSIVGAAIYFSHFYTNPTCFDQKQNADEHGVDCGGTCLRICAFEVAPPTVLWSRAFQIRDDEYNAVAYVENKNLNSGSPEVKYTFSFYDSEGLITTRSGMTVLPPDSVYPLFEGRILTGGRQITQTFVEIEGADVWLPGENGRDQFVVESRELTGADSKPELSARITNKMLIPAKDVEIVATIFDARGNALTASRTVVPNFAPRKTENIVFTWPSPIAKTVRSCEVPTDVMLLVDLSGSMNNDGGDPPEPVSSTLEAATSFVSRLRSKDQGGVVTFATDANLAKRLSGDVSAVATVVSNLSIDPKEETGATNIGDPIKVATEELASSRHNADARKVIVLLTDGLANAPETKTAEQYALDAATLAKSSDITIFTIGLGAKVNKEFLSTIASSREQSYFAAGVGTLNQVYQTISAAICEDGAAVIEIIPKTETSFESE